MGRWSAVSDLDYEEEQNHVPARFRRPRCLECGRPMDIECDGDGEPVKARCLVCHPRKVKAS